MSRGDKIESDQKSKDYQEAIKNVVDHLKCKRDELRSELTCDEQEKAKVVKEINHLQDKLSILEATIRKKHDFTKEYDKAINESEKNFTQLLKKSEDYLSLTRREALTLAHVVDDFETPPQDEHHKNVMTKKQHLPECPQAVFTINTPETEGCANCSSATPCTTIMIPFRANGL